MKRVPVSSSNLKEVGYDKETKTLEVAFKTSGVYQYSDVPLTEYEALLQADSVGTYFDSNIKYKYACVKV